MKNEKVKMKNPLVFLGALYWRALVAIFMAVHHEGATAGPRPETMKL